jgi:hypothetical protein
MRIRKEPFRDVASVVMVVEGENEDDRYTFRSVVGLSEQKIYLILRVGVDMNSFAPANRRSSCNVMVVLQVGGFCK